MSSAGSLGRNALSWLTIHRIATTMPAITTPQNISIVTIIAIQKTPDNPQIRGMSHPHSYERSCPAAEGHSPIMIPRGVKGASATFHSSPRSRLRPRDIRGPRFGGRIDQRRRELLSLPVSSLRLRGPAQVRSEQKAQARGGNVGACLQEFYQVPEDTENLDDLRCQPLAFTERHRLNGRCQVAGDACKGTDLISTDDGVSHLQMLDSQKSQRRVKQDVADGSHRPNACGSYAPVAHRRTAEGERGVPADLRAARSSGGALV